MVGQMSVLRPLLWVPWQMGEGGEVYTLDTAQERKGNNEKRDQTSPQQTRETQEIRELRNAFIWKFMWKDIESIVKFFYSLKKTL